MSKFKQFLFSGDAGRTGPLVELLHERFSRTALSLNLQQGSRTVHFPRGQFEGVEREIEQVARPGDPLYSHILSRNVLFKAYSKRNGDAKYN